MPLSLTFGHKTGHGYKPGYKNYKSGYKKCNGSNAVIARVPGVFRGHVTRLQIKNYMPIGEKEKIYILPI